ncbi:MAG: prolipoprotein diacylglyceryl transferase [Gammaproteobacteria bacterium]|nr:prolipoprotein diacylglyceryl transferase [Gammaproteobacteria bacterium]
MEITLQQHIEILEAGNRIAYQICVVLAAIVGGWFIRQDSKQWTLSEAQRLTLFTIAFIGAMAGAAIPAHFAGGFVEELTLLTPITPKTVMGGIVFSFLLVAAYKIAVGNHYDTSDAFARGAISMMAIGRIACIFQHCCYGKVSDWGMDFGDGLQRIPVQYIEAIALFAILAFIQFCHVKNLFPGRRLFLVFLCYGSLRFVMEFLREPIADQYLGLGFYQWIALTIALIGLFQLYKRRPQQRFQGVRI